MNACSHVDHDGVPDSLNQGIADAGPATAKLPIDVISHGDWHGFFRTVPAAYFVTNARGQLLDANERLAQLLGCNSLGDLYALTRKNGGVDVFYVQNGQRERVLELIRSKGFVQDHPVLLKRLDGALVRCFMSARVCESGRNPLFYQGFFLDRSEMHTAYRAVVDYYRLHARFLEVIPIPSACLDGANILKVNTAFARFFGVEKPKEMEGRDLSAFLHPDSRWLAEAWCFELVGRRESDSGMREAELQLIFLDGRRRQVLIRGTRMRFNERSVVLCALEDQTEQREVKSALNMARKRIGEILRNSPVGFAMIGRDRRYIEVNHHFAAIHGYDSPLDMQETVRDIRMQVFADPEDATELVRILERDGVVHDYKCLARRKDGSLFWTSRTVRKIYDFNKYRILCECYITDIDAAMRAEMLAGERERKVRALAEALLRTTERERQQLAKNLHDGPMQLLAVSKVMLDRMADDSVSAARDIDTVSSLVARGLDMMRTCMVELCPPALFQEDIGVMFGHLALEFKEAFGLGVELECGEMPDMSIEGKAFLFRSAREFLVNAVKHGNAGRAGVSLSLLDDRDVVLEVTDDGQGGHPGSVDGVTRSMGLPSLRRRAADMGGRLEVDMAPGGGARVVMVLPLDVLAVGSEGT